MIDLDYDVVPHLSSGIVERAKRERARENHSTREKATRGGDHIFLSLPAACRLSRVGWFSRTLSFRSL